MKKALRLIILIHLSIIFGCGSEQIAERDVSAIVAHYPEDLSRCSAPENANISGIESVVQWINAMPKPLTLACFIASLPRPLAYNATSSTFSLQPAVGEHNPRIFINFGKLWLSFVPQEDVEKKVNSETGEEEYFWDEDGIQLLEMSVEVDSDRLHPQSIKGELTFPVLDTLPRNAAYARVLRESNPEQSRCSSACHASEVIVDTVDGVPVFRSIMLRPLRVSDISHSYLVHQYLSCDPELNTGRGPDNNEWYRCQMLAAFLGRGSMTRTEFREEIFTFLVE